MTKVLEKKLEKMGYTVQHKHDERIFVYKKDNPEPIGLLSGEEVIMAIYNVRAEVPLADVVVTDTFRRLLSSFVGIELDTWPYGAQEMHDPYQLVIKAKINRQSLQTASKLYEKIGNLKCRKELANAAEEGVKRLEEQLIIKVIDAREIKPIFNPAGPDRQATEELIRALSTVLDSPATGSETKAYTSKMILAIKEGYEIQSEEKYKGFLPELHFV